MISTFARVLKHSYQLPKMALLIRGKLILVNNENESLPLAGLSLQTKSQNYQLSAQEMIWDYFLDEEEGIIQSSLDGLEIKTDIKVVSRC